MVKILITGASGFVGTRLMTLLGKTNEVIGTCNTDIVPGLYQLDITNKRAVHLFIKKHKPDVVIHTAAITNVGVCEKNKKLAEQVNHLGTRNVVEACRETGSKLVYTSSDYIFDGTRGNYSEQHRPNPLNVYGVTKLRGERAVRSLRNHIILRFSMLYGYNGKSKRNGFFSLLLQNKPITVRADQLRHPLHVDDLAYSITKLLEANRRGTFHLAGSQVTTVHELALGLSRLVRLGQNVRLTPVHGSSDDIARPHDASLDTTKAQRVGLQFSSLEQGLHKMRNQLREE